MGSFSFITSMVCSAFAASGIGTRVLNAEEFLASLDAALAAHDVSADRTPGQHFVQLPIEAHSYVGCGVGRRTANPEDYVLREWRGVVSAFLRREAASTSDSLAAIVYTREAYHADPEVDEAEKARTAEASHIVVAVLAAAGPRPPRGPARLLAAIGGENNEFSWLGADLSGALELASGTHRAKCSLSAVAELQERMQALVADAAASVEYDREWCVVAD